MMPKKSPNPIDKHVGSRVRMRRIMLDMSQTTLGDGLGVSFQQVIREWHEPHRGEPLAAHFPNPASPCGVLLRWRGACSGAYIAGHATLAGLLDRFHGNARRAHAGQSIHENQQYPIAAADRRS